MFIIPIACILTGCLSDINTRKFDKIVDDPPKALITELSRQNKSKGINPACYINGEFFKSCPTH